MNSEAVEVELFVELGSVKKGVSFEDRVYGIPEGYGVIDAHGFPRWGQIHICIDVPIINGEAALINDLFWVNNPVLASSIDSYSAIQGYNARINMAIRISCHFSI